jgi:hypothetical protein
MGDKDFNSLPATSQDNSHCQYGLDVYVEDFMSIVIPTSRDQLEHVMTVVMTGIQDVFPTNFIDSKDPILEKQMLKGEGKNSLIKALLGFEFDCKQKTTWLEEVKQAKTPHHTAQLDPGGKSWPGGLLPRVQIRGGKVEACLHGPAGRPGTPITV